MTREIITQRLRRIHAPIWALAAEMNVHENTVRNWFHAPITKERAKRIEAALQRMEARYDGN